MRRGYSSFQEEENQAKDWNMNNAWHMEIMNLWREAAVYRQKRNDESSLEAYWDALRSIWGSMLYDVEKLIIDRRGEIEDAEIQKQNGIVDEIKKDFEKANTIFMLKSASGANAAAIKILDGLEMNLKYITGAIQYYKFRKDPFDMRYND